MSISHRCPVCNAPGISSFGKFVAGALIPARCTSCGAVLGVRGAIWSIVSLLLTGIPHLVSLH